ncbi:MAG: sugar phosphate isomerase/epimerase [Chloroflexi bacterium]|nr:sugar phosphate isomerase/epimerase [Chloroflexota bacterium]
MPITFTIFTKPWKLEIPVLASYVQQLGFGGVELPVRPGYPVNPDNVESALPQAVKQFQEHGLAIASIAGATDERTITACGAAGVPVIRACISIPKDRNYLEYETEAQREYAALIPALAQARVTIGVQNHCGRDVANAMGLRHFLEPFDRKHVAAVWDPAHCALQGEIPELAIDMVWSHLCMVNLKNAYWLRTNGPEAEYALYKHYWTSGRQGLCPWPTVVRLLKERHYSGPVCLTAEYSDTNSVDRLIREDLAFAQSLFATV